MEITVTYHCPRAFVKPYILSKTKNDKFCHNSIKLLSLSTHPAVSHHLPFGTQSLFFYISVMYNVLRKGNLIFCDILVRLVETDEEMTRSLMD